MTTLTIELPDPLTEQLQINGISQQQLQLLITRFIQNYVYQYHLADQHTLTPSIGDISEIVTDLLAEPLPEDIANELDQLAHLENDDLWLAAQAQLTLDETDQMQILLDRRQQLGGLNSDEQKIVQRLSHRYNRTMLVRAKAAALLKERGYDVSDLRQRVIAV